MKYLLTEEEIEIPEGVTIESNSRQVVVKGKLGELRRNFRHVALDIFRHNKKIGDKTVKTLKFQMWQAKRKQKCCVSSVASVVRNMIRGVTTGYKFKMALAYAHFPIIAEAKDNGKFLEVKNFLGEKIIRRIECLPGVTVSKTDEEKSKL
jgi:large subunit ribosomal protein L9e